QGVAQVSRMLAEGSGSEQHKRAERQRLDALLAFCETAGCRRQSLLAYFGDTLEEPRGRCDTCLAPVETFHGTEAAQKLLSTVVRTGQRFGAGHLVDVLLGRETERVMKLGHQHLSTFGIGGDLDDSQWRSVTRQLLANGQLAADPDGFGGLRVGPGAGAVIGGEKDVVLRRDQLVRRGRSRSARGAAARPPAQTTMATPAEQGLFEELRALRSGIAKELSLPPYVIF